TSQDAVDKAGIEVEPVSKAPVVEYVTGNGEISYDQTRTARLSARVPGTVFRVYKQAGDPVKKGEVLALVDAAEVGKAKSESVTGSMDPQKTTGNLMAVTAPFEGVTVARETVAGEVVDTHKVLFVVVDIRQVWLTLDLRLEDSKSGHLGQKVQFRPDGGREE